MNVLLLGATGMVGQGVLRECLKDPRVLSVQTVGRTATGITNPKLRDSVSANFSNFESIRGDLSGFDACFFCLGVTSGGKKQEEYERLTYGITLAAAQVLAEMSPKMTFVYVSGTGTDSSETGRVMWARVKGKTENALQRLPFRAVYLFRPGVIQPLHGIRSKTPSYQFFYSLLKPVLPVLRWAMPTLILTTEQVGRAMIEAAIHGAPKAVLESEDIYRLSTAGQRAN